MRVLVSTVAFSSERFVIIAATAIARPSPGPPINAAASEKYPVCHFCQSPSAASENIVGRKYVAIESGITTASDRIAALGILHFFRHARDLLVPRVKPQAQRQPRAENLKPWHVRRHQRRKW